MTAFSSTEYSVQHSVQTIIPPLLRSTTIQYSYTDIYISPPLYILILTLNPESLLRRYSGVHPVGHTSLTGGENGPSPTLFAPSPANRPDLG